VPEETRARATLRRMSAGESAVSIRHSSGAVSPLTALRVGVSEILSRRRLIRFLVAADMKKRGSDTVLGNLWWVLDPLLQMVVYVVFVTVISKKPAPDYPLFIFAAILPWKWFSAVVGDATTSVVNQEKLIRQIAFPKLVLPVSTATAGVVGFGWGLIPLAGLMLLHPTRISIMVLWIPVIAAVQYVFTLAFAILVSAANVYARDLGNAVGHVLRLWWFLSPGLYSLASLENIGTIRNHPILGTLAAANPFAILFEAYRAVIYGDADGIGPPHAPDLASLFYLLLGSFVFLGIVIVFFKRVEPDFAKVL
jgi:lipopolysaccharide transport system permease protein